MLHSKMAVCFKPFNITVFKKNSSEKSDIEPIAGLWNTVKHSEITLLNTSRCFHRL